MKTVNSNKVIIAKTWTRPVRIALDMLSPPTVLSLA